MQPARPQRTPHEELRSIYEQEFRFVWSFLRRLGADGKDLEDLTHDVFVTAFRRWSTFDSSRPVRPWLLGIAYRTALDFKRLAQHSREQPTDELPETVDTAPAPLEKLLSAEAQSLVKEALETLPLSQRAIFVLHELQGQPIPAIAQALDVPLNTAYSRLRLARATFTAVARRLALRRGET